MCDRPGERAGTATSTAASPTRSSAKAVPDRRRPSLATVTSDSATPPTATRSGATRRSAPNDTGGATMTSASDDEQQPGGPERVELGVAERHTGDGDRQRPGGQRPAPR